MKIDNLIVMKAQLESLFDMFYIAQCTKDGRRCEKNIREARQAISDYSQTIPTEVMDHFIRKYQVPVPMIQSNTTKLHYKSSAY